VVYGVCRGKDDTDRRNLDPRQAVAGLHRRWRFVTVGADAVQQQVHRTEAHDAIDSLAVLKPRELSTLNDLLRKVLVSLEAVEHDAVQPAGA